MKTATRPCQALTACFVVVLLLSASTTTARAGENSLQFAQLLNVAQSTSSLTAADAAIIVAKRTGGQVLSVTTVVTENGKIHRVKVLLAGGRVKVFKVRATGQ